MFGIFGLKIQNLQFSWKISMENGKNAQLSPFLPKNTKNLQFWKQKSKIFKFAFLQKKSEFLDEKYKLKKKFFFQKNGQKKHLKNQKNRFLPIFSLNFIIPEIRIKLP